MSKLGKVPLVIHFRGDFPDSAAFMKKLGSFVRSGEFFLPGNHDCREGDHVGIHFTLDGGRRDILKGEAEVVGRHEGGGGRPKGLHLRWLDFDERTRINLEMIERWQASQQPAAPHD